MKKYDQFFIAHESKNNIVKNQDQLKLKKKNMKYKTDQQKKRQEIIDNHSNFIAGASGFAQESVNISNGEKHFNMEVKITPEWILSKMSLSKYADGHGVIRFYAIEENYHWLELAFETMGVSYIRDEIEVNCLSNVISYELLIDSIMDQCPILYREMWDLNVKECLED